MHTLIMLP